jgi:hypothetical protein
MTFGLDLTGPHFETILSINFLMPYQTMHDMYVLWIFLVPFVEFFGTFCGCFHWYLCYSFR